VEYAGDKWLYIYAPVGKTDIMMCSLIPQDNIVKEVSFIRNLCIIMVILACDVPLTSRQLKRVIKRCSVGIARCGSYIGHGSGEVFIGFSTSNRFSSSDDDIVSISCVKESKLDILFRAAGEATEEAILNSMVCAEELHAFNGTLLKSLKDIL